MRNQKEKPQTVICIQNDGNENIEPGKVYQTLEDNSPSQEESLRVIDESRVDYLSLENDLVAIPSPRNAERALFTTPASIP